MVRLFSVSLVLYLNLIGIQAQDNPPIFVEQSAAIRKTLVDAKQIYIFEGLPHQRDVKLLKSERLRKDTVEFADFPFYTPKVPIQDAELAAKLKSLGSKAGSYTIFSGEKRCGGFHPDFALQWFDGEKDCKILFCYGCSEVLIVSGSETYRYDCPKILELRKLLEPFQYKRPDKVAHFARINFNNAAFHSQHIVDICVYKEAWEPPNEQFRKGHIKRYATIVGVHKGNLKIGDKIAYNLFIEVPVKDIGKVAKEKPSEIKIVEGELEVIMFSDADVDQDEAKNGYHMKGDAGFKFSFGDQFYAALLERKKVDPELKGSSLEDGK